MYQICGYPVSDKMACLNTVYSPICESCLLGDENKREGIYLHVIVNKQSQHKYNIYICRRLPRKNTPPSWSLVFVDVISLLLPERARYTHR